MSREIYSDADNLSVPVPSGLVKGDAVRVGGLNGVLVTDRKPSSETPTDTQGPAFAGGNPPGYASVKLKGGHEFDGIAFAVLDLSGPWRLAFDTMLAHATQIADPFHVVKLANERLDEVRRRVQNATLGHRGHKADPLYRSRRLLTMADERLSPDGRTKLMGLLDAGDPNGEVRTAWNAKEVVRMIYEHHDPDLALEFVTRLGADLQHDDCPPEIRRLGRTITKWRHQIAAWHGAYLSNGPTEGANNLIKVVKRIAFGFTSFRNYRIRTLLYAGRPNWDLLPTITPTSP